MCAQVSRAAQPQAQRIVVHYAGAARVHTWGVLEWARACVLGRGSARKAPLLS